ncbi:type III-B CRISPR module-associated protein Cmr5 [Endozoicomonas sp. 2B-B]
MSLKVKVRHKGEGVKIDKPRTVQQQRAAFSYERVSQVVALKNPDAAKVFKAKANSLPAMVQMNGLGQSLAFAKSKADPQKAEGIAWQHLYDLVSDWHGRETGCYPDTDVLEGIMSQDMHVYRQAQAETQALMVWVKQFARAEIRISEEGGEE